MATGITQDDVWKAADALLMEGARPTIERVRQKIGRGSPNTVSPYLDTWFRSLGARIGHASGLQPPDGSNAGSGIAGGLPAPVAEAAGELWAAARQAARIELEQEAARLRADADAERELLARDRQAAQDQATRLQAREQDLQEAIALLKSQLHAAEARAQGLAQEQQRNLERLADMTAQAGEARHAHDRLVEQMQAERAAHASERARADERARAQETRWLNELDAAREAARRLQQQLDRTVKAADTRQEKLGEALAQSQKAAVQAQEASTHLQQALVETRHELGETRAHLDQMALAQQERAEHIDALRSQLDENRQANERAFALHAAREAEWVQQAAQWRTDLQQARDALLRAQAETAARDRTIDELRRAGRSARPVGGTPDSAS